MDRLQKIESLFSGALERPPAERDAWLCAECGSDSGMLREVRTLLENHRDDDSETWAAAAAANLVALPAGLKSGARLGPYEILELIGSGGMGEVYRARDTKLRRHVAVKVLPDAFANDPERLARFTREAQVLASLNHPNIAAIYGVEERALVMELVDGPTLAERIASGRVTIDEALSIAKQIAEALDYAHEKGIVHRDLKPANIKLTSEDRVKVLDFGLAKALGDQNAQLDRGSSPTLTIGAESRGMILGTAGYMSPEQARGKPVDKRTDIWAFGCVLFELLTGKRAFNGESASDILASVIKGEPDLGTVPSHLRSVVAKCFRKDPRARWRDIGDVRLALEESILPETTPSRTPATAPWLIVAALVAALMVIGVALWRVTRPVQNRLMRLSVELGPIVDTNGGANAIISPDGTRLVFAIIGGDGKGRLATRLLSESQSTPLAETGNLRASPFFSPNGEWIGFFAEGKLKKIPVQGGAAVAICDASNPRGASWGDDDQIVFSPGLRSGLVRVPSSGGVPQPLTQLKSGETSHRWPQVLPGAGAVMFTAGSGSGVRWEDSSIEIQSLRTGQRRTLHRGGSYGRYVRAGYLLYVHQTALFARPFNLDREEVTGLPVRILEDVTYSAVTGGAQFDVSDSPPGHGTLIYRSGKEAQTAIYSVDQSGETLPLVHAPGVYFNPRFSPDGKRLAVSLFSGNLGLWILEQDRRFVRLTSTGGDNRAVWAPDGKHIAYVSAQVGVFWVASDASGPSVKLFESPTVAFINSFSPDGKRLAYSQGSPETGLDIWMLPIEGSASDHPQVGTPEVFLRTPANESWPAFSPDGRWVAYSSDESGNSEVYVRPYPGPGSRSRVSSAGGRLPMWSRSGRELAYATPDGRLIIAECNAAGGTFTVGKLRFWSGRPVTSLRQENIDLSPDGKHLAALLAPESGAPATSSDSVTFLANIVDELRQRVAAVAK